MERIKIKDTVIELFSKNMYIQVGTHMDRQVKRITFKNMIMLRFNLSSQNYKCDGYKSLVIQ